jgi:hypothetical protein
VLVVITQVAVVLALVQAKLQEAAVQAEVVLVRLVKLELLELLEPQIQVAVVVHLVVFLAIQTALVVVAVLV